MASSSYINSFGICDVFSSHALGMSEIMFNMACESPWYLYVSSSNPLKITWLSYVSIVVSFSVCDESITVASSVNFLICIFSRFLLLIV